MIHLSLIESVEPDSSHRNMRLLKILLPKREWVLWSTLDRRDSHLQDKQASCLITSVSILQTVRGIGTTLLTRKRIETQAAKSANGQSHNLQLSKRKRSSQRSRLLPSHRWTRTWEASTLSLNQMNPSHPTFHSKTILRLPLSNNSQRRNLSSKQVPIHLLRELVE